MSPAWSADRPTKEVSGAGSGTMILAVSPAPPEPPAGSRAALAASARRSSTWSFLSIEETWLSTVRTEMNSRAAISALVRCSPIATSTSASRAETPTSCAAIWPATPTPGTAPGRARARPEDSTQQCGGTVHVPPHRLLLRPLRQLLTAQRDGRHGPAGDGERHRPDGL